MIEIYTDGATRKGGQASCAFVVYDAGKEIDTFSRYLGIGITNNVAEYEGLLHAMAYLFHKGLKGADIFSDSQLIVNQVNGSFALNEPHLKGFCHLAQSLKIRGGHRLHHVKGHDGNQGNERADQLCNECLDKEGTNDSKKENTEVQSHS